MRPPLCVRVRGRQLRCLQTLVRHAPCPRTRLRAQVVLLCHRGYSVEEIAGITRHSDDPVRYWLGRFQRHGGPGLREGVHTGRPPTVTPAVEQLLREWALQSPRERQGQRIKIPPNYWRAIDFVKGLALPLLPGRPVHGGA